MRVSSTLLKILVLLVLASATALPTADQARAAETAFTPHMASISPRPRPTAPWAKLVQARPQRARAPVHRSAEGSHYRAFWSRGLAAWQRQDFAVAAARFETIAKLNNAPSQAAAAAAFWAARANLFARRPEHVTTYLTQAANHPESFYGLVARHILGMPLPFHWGLSDADKSAAEALEKTPLGQRILALIDQGDTRSAERALRKAAYASSGAHAHGAMVIAERAGFAHLAFRLRSRLGRQFDTLHAALYPVPKWRPKGGFDEDPALILALARQESRFDPNAVSVVGARGLLQVMPATARIVDQRSHASHIDWRRLDEPQTNLAIGQRYIGMLIRDEQVNNDLVSLAVAWNAGPGNFKKWRADRPSVDDPLLFIETIPVQQTRRFVQHVLANYWIYRDRFGLPSPSLDAVASGRWPTYIQPSAVERELAQYHE